MIDTDRTIEGAGRRLADGLMADLAATVGGMSDGQLLALHVAPDDAEGVLLWSRLTGHPVVERVDGSAVVRLVIRKGHAVAVADDEHALGARLWLYTNIHCNLQCDYCCVRSSPTVPPRLLPLVEAGRLVHEAKALGFRHVFLTGGEPFLHPDLLKIVQAAAEVLPTTLLTNAMLFQGKRLDALRAMSRDRVVLQVSLDSPTADLHDRHRGPGTWQKAWDGIRTARALGFRVRVAATCARKEDRDAMERFLAEQGFPEDDRVVRPLARLGNAKGANAGVPLARHDLVPELTVTAEGVFWHPVGVGEVELRVAPPGLPLADALDAIRTLQREDAKTHETLASVFHCA